MKKTYVTYLLLIISALLISIILNAFYEPYPYSNFQFVTDQNPFAEALINPVNVVSVVSLVCFVHWLLVARKRPKVLSGQATTTLRIIGVSTAVTFAAGVAAFFTIVLAAAKSEPLFGLFIFALPMIALLSAATGAGIGLLIALYRKRKLF